jgi:phage terminase large subunit
MAAATSARPERVVTLQLPRKLAFLLELHSYKVAYGGRASLKSWNFARALLTLGIHQDLRILCLREVQKSLTDSVHLLLTDQVKRLGYDSLYHITDNAIRGTKRDTLFRFSGLSDQTSDSMKSYEGFDIFWFEEAQRITKRSFQIALPTLFRTKGAEAWVAFNPDLDTDEVWERFIVHPPEDTVVQEMNFLDAAACGWMTVENERLRQYDLVHSPLEYDNIWNGIPRTFVAGAIYGREIADMMRGGRFRPMPYDPRLPVHRIWDLGWNDLMTVVMVQKPVPSAISIINYIEESQATYAEMVQMMANLRYRVGIDWLPHDAVQHHPTSGTNAVKQLRELGCKVKVIQRSDPEARIRAARMMFPRIYMDTSKHETPPERPNQLLGAGNLMDRLKRYRRNVPKITNEPTTPLHDAPSHGADAFGALAEIVDQIRNEGDGKVITVPGFANVDPAMGMLG